MRNKFDEVIGLFWGAALFIGALVAVIIGFAGNMRSDWIFAGLVGVCVFLITGLMLQGIITLAGLVWKNIFKIVEKYNNDKD